MRTHIIIITIIIIIIIWPPQSRMRWTTQPNTRGTVKHVYLAVMTVGCIQKMIFRPINCCTAGFHTFGLCRAVQLCVCVWVCLCACVMRTCSWYAMCCRLDKSDAGIVLCCSKRKQGKYEPNRSCWWTMAHNHARLLGSYLRNHLATCTKRIAFSNNNQTDITWLVGLCVIVWNDNKADVAHYTCVNTASIVSNWLSLSTPS